MAKATVKVSSAGVAAILTSAKMRQLLKDRGAKVKAADGSFVGYEGTSPGGGWASSRARYRVGYPASMGISAAMSKEAKSGKLMRALMGGTGLVRYVNKAGKSSYITGKQSDNYNSKKK